MLLREECSINSCGQNFPKITEKKLNVSKNCNLEICHFIKMDSIAANGPKIKLVIYQSAFCCCFFSGAMVSCLKEVFWFLCLL